MKIKNKILLIMVSFIALCTNVYADTCPTGEYYNEDSSKGFVGCVTLNEENCGLMNFFWDGNSCDTSKTGYTVTFDDRIGYGLECDDGKYYVQDGVCRGFYALNSEISFPKSSSTMTKDNNYLIGWSKNPKCLNKQILKYNKTFEATGSSTYYSCYSETVSAYRYLKEGAEVDKPSNVSELKCGDEFYIDYCNRPSSDEKEYCYGTREGVVRKIDRDKITDELAGALSTCSNNDSSLEHKNEWRYVTLNDENYGCGDELFITTCTDEICNYTKVRYNNVEKNKEGTVNRNSLKESKNAFSCKVTIHDKETCSNDPKKAMTGSGNYTLCYDENAESNDIESLLENVYHCDTNKGYTFDRTSVKAVGSKAECSDGVCVRTYNVTCTKGKSLKPTLSVTSGMVQGDTGTITVKAISSGTKIDSYYYSNEYLAPTNNSKWNKLDSDTFTITETPGIYYIWVRDINGQISNAVSGAVLDPNNSNTTVKNLQLYDANGNVQSINRVVYKSGDITSSKYALLSNDLSKDSQVLADGFNPFDMEYKLEVNGPTVSVYATLTSTDSNYVDGYEPRTVNLNYGVNTILIKIKDKENKVRTYTILVTRVDDRTSDNTLSNIQTSVGKIQFNANVTDYKIEIPKNTNSVNVSSTISSDKAKYVEGYEPGEVLIKDDTTVKLIKVLSETGSTRTYVLTFIKEGTDVISDKTLQINELRIPGVYLPFERNVSNYSLSVDYQTDTININGLTFDDDSYYEVSIKRKSDTEYKLTSNVGIGLDVGENFIEIKVTNNIGETAYYRITIIRKEFGLEISNDVTLKDLKVLGYNIKFNPNKKEYTVKIKQEKSLVVTAVPNSNRAEVFIRGNEELTGFSTVRVKVVAENGMFDTYSIDIKKDAFNKTIEIASIIAGCVIILFSSCIIVLRKKNRVRKEYFEE